MCCKQLPLTFPDHVHVCTHCSVSLHVPDEVEIVWDSLAIVHANQFDILSCVCTEDNVPNIVCCTRERVA